MGKKIIEILTLFGIVFSFKVPFIGYSSILMFGCLAFLSMFTAKHTYRNLGQLFENKTYIKIIFILVLIIVSTFLVTIFHNAYDFSLLPTLINQLFNLVLVGLYISIFYRVDKPFFYYLEIVCYCFAFQSCIMILSLLSPAFKVLIEFTQDPSVIEKSLTSYGGNRNLAFGVTQFYGLNATMGVVFILNSFLFAYRKLPKYFVTLILIGIGIFLSGRTSLLGVGLGIIFIMLNVRFKVNKDYKLIGFLLIMFLVFVLGYNFIINLIPETILNWGLEFYYNYQDKGEFASRSSNKLFDEMYFMPDVSMLLFGSGKYTESDGSYFMHTDAGFMRHILYYGLLGLVMYFYYHFYVLYGIYRQLSSNVKWRTNNILFLFLGVFSVVLNVKGEFLGFLIMAQNVFFVILFSLILYNISLRAK